MENCSLVIHAANVISHVLIIPYDSHGTGCVMSDLSV
jgi:hypothetical protein